MGSLGLLVLAAVAWTSWQQLESIQFRHLCTYGSKYGIHPPRLLNGRTARVALGNPDNPYGLVTPTAVATDLRGRVWIADVGTNSLHIFDRKTGAYREIRRLAQTPIQQPWGLTSDDQGRIYMTDAGNGGVFVFDEKGEYDHELTRHNERILQTPGAIALSANGRTIYVADPSRNVIVALNREGEVDETIDLPPDYSQPSNLSIVDNQIYVLSRSTHKVGIFTPAGRLRGEYRWADAPLPSAFAFDPVRRQFLAANPQTMVIGIFNMEGRSLANFGARGDGLDQMQNVNVLQTDSQGSVYIVDTLHGKVLVFIRES